MRDIHALPPDCPLLEEHNKLRDLILGMNDELVSHFGRFAKLDVQSVNPESAAYKEEGLRWFVLFPWPAINGENHRKLMKYSADRIRAFDTLLDKESFGCNTIVAGGVVALMIGLREKQPAQTPAETVA